MSKNRKFYIGGFIVSLFLAGVVSFYASSSPDGLEKVAGDIVDYIMVGLNDIAGSSK